MNVVYALCLRRSESLQLQSQYQAVGPYRRFPDLRIAIDAQTDFSVVTALWTVAQGLKPAVYELQSTAEDENISDRFCKI
eukprot:COSAG02_NODE_28600_length_586_cov_1.162218_2_plen_79_part_01